ncbi:MAG TPA: ATP-dependent DNA ligase [Gemmatimonadaceae bacterium]|nr:ATP-dependent DNA ligase [Gemmatimonadaceae bacterium]
MKSHPRPGIAPMEARVVDELPVGPQWQYEPKWDGFRCLCFRDGDSVELRSKSDQPLTRYFPELADALRAIPVRRFVLDGEIVVPTPRGLSFDALLLRLHPARSRVEKLSRETPAALLVFDLLADAKGTDLMDHPLSERRERLEQFAARNFRSTPSIMLSPATRRLSQARAWLAGRAGTDGVMAKRLDLPYASGERTAMEKIKRKRTADCVVGGFRYATKGKIVGSLLLGLYDDDGLLHHVGFTSSLTADERKRITSRFESLAGGSGFTGRAPGGPSRWSTARSGEWVPLEPVLVVEVQYDHFTGGRFRHGTKFIRWRPEKAPAQCRLSQVAEARREAAATSTEGGRPVAPKRQRLRSIGPRTARGTHVAPPRATRARRRSGR